MVLYRIGSLEIDAEVRQFIQQVLYRIGSLEKR